MRKLVISLFTILTLVSYPIQAQTTKGEFFSNSAYASGVYQVYKHGISSATPAPEGYKPFYISHYGRHGSRWVHSEESYTYPQNILRDAYEANKLTDLGISVYNKVNLAAQDAYGRYGGLTPRGVEEHRGIAERMFFSFPEVFSTENGRECTIFSRSTIVPRCVLSMAANNERFKELNPQIKMIRDAANRYQYLSNIYKNPKKDSTYAIRDRFIENNMDIDKFLATLFNDPLYVKEKIENRVSFVRALHSIAIDLPCAGHLNISMLDIFSKNELFTLWQGLNMVMYYNTGPSSVTGKIAMDSSKLLLNNIIECADNAIAKGDISADLRFGHDTFIIPLLALMEIEGMNTQEDDPSEIYKVWSDFKISPMAVNIQLVFFRNENSGEVIVKILHCENEVNIPVKTDIAPYYKWADVKAFYEQKL